MKAITIDAPWAWAIVHGHKRVENRTWRTNHRGRLAIHAGRATRSDAAAAAVFASLGIQAPTGDELDALRGCVLGLVSVVDCIPRSEAGGDGLAAQVDAGDPFVTGPVCWLLGDPVAILSPPAIAGKQSLWTLDDGLLLACGAK